MKKYATQDCHVTVGDQEADVRAKVTSVDGLLVNFNDEVVS